MKFPVFLFALVLSIATQRNRHCLADEAESFCDENGVCVDPQGAFDYDDDGLDEDTYEEGEEGDDLEQQYDDTECVDVAEDCQERKLQHECILDYPTMAEECSATCLFCTTTDENPTQVSNIYSDFPQFLYNDNAIRQIVARTDRYVYDRIYSSEEIEDEIKLNCRNKDAQCSYWARDGRCRSNSDMMRRRCPAACLACDANLAESVRCAFGPNEEIIWKAGDLNAMFTHLTTWTEFNEYDIEVISRPISQPNPKFQETSGPWIVTLDSFLSDEACQALLELAETFDYQVQRNINNEEETERLLEAYQCVDECGELDVVKQMEETLDSLVKIPRFHYEPVEFTKYKVDGFWGLHSDYLPTEFSAPQGPRSLTVVVFLNDMPQSDDVEIDDDEDPNGGIYFESIDRVSTEQKFE